MQKLVVSSQIMFVGQRVSNWELRLPRQEEYRGGDRRRGYCVR